jgi:hypothetical protein
MDLTPENKKHIDSMNVYTLLYNWRFAKSGDHWFQGETGAYWAQRLNYFQENERHEYVQASKEIGWTK